MTPLTGDLGTADLPVVLRWADPRALLKAGPARLQAVIVRASRHHQGQARAQQWRDAAAAAVELYGQHPAVDFADLAAEVATEVRLLRRAQRAVQAELTEHAARREEAYRWVDHGQLARTLPGLADVGAPVLVAAMGRPARFTTSATSSPSPACPPAPPKPVRPTARANRWAKQAPPCCAPR